MSDDISQKQYVLFTARRAVDSLIFNMSSAEGNPITLEEVMTLVDGITIGGHRISDQNQILRLKDSWNELFRLVENDEFEVSKQTAIHLNALVAKDEATKVGAFRDKQVFFRGLIYEPPHHARLDDKFNEVLEFVGQYNNPIDRAIACFTQCSRNQFFYDGNKRTSQLLMNGILLSSSQHVITIPAVDISDYHYRMSEFYESNDSEKISRFLKERQIDKIAKVKVRDIRGDAV